MPASCATPSVYVYQLHAYFCARLRSLSAFSISNLALSTRFKKSFLARYPSFVACSSSSAIPCSSLNLSQSLLVFVVTEIVVGLAMDARTLSKLVVCFLACTCESRVVKRITLQFCTEVQLKNVTTCRACSFASLVPASNVFVTLEQDRQRHATHNTQHKTQNPQHTT